MCCLLSILAVLGPRFAILVWWFANPGRFDRVFDTFFWPFLGFMFLPWTTLMYVAVGVGGVSGFDWVWIALAVFIDISSYSGGAYGNRDRGMEYANRYR